MFNTIISAAELLDHLPNQNWRIIDCHHDLNDTEAGRRAHSAGHIPGALFAHLDEDLSGTHYSWQYGAAPLTLRDRDGTAV